MQIVRIILVYLLQITAYVRGVCCVFANQLPIYLTLRSVVHAHT